MVTKNYSSSVRTTSGSLVSYVDTDEAGESSVLERNKRAEELGIETRYVYDATPVTISND